MAVCTSSYIDIAEVLLDAGANPSAQDDLGVTPLMDAAHSGQLLMLKLLMKCGAKIHLQSRDGMTALDLATSERHVHVMEVLRQAVAKKKEGKPWWKIF